ncbi:MAG: hypothetical protein KC621_10505, partial [Myxococcales bacterium]|nr:hypothetical protein [Myxococcales bacterium]
LRVISTDPAGPPDRVVPVDLSVAISVASEATGEGWIVAGLYDPSDHPYRVLEVTADGDQHVLWSSMSWFLYAPTPSPDGRTVAMGAYAFDDDVWGVDGLLNAE